MIPEERKAIDKLASAVRSYIVGQNDNFNLEPQLEAKGIEVKYFNNDRYDAFLKWDKERKIPIISVNVMQPSTRQKFSIAHELGHLIIDWEWMPGDDLSDKGKNVLSIKYRGADHYTPKESESEKRANEFAAAFLMPDDEIEKLLNDSDQVFMTGIIRKIAIKFGVSEKAADIRLRNYLKD